MLTTVSIRGGHPQVNFQPETPEELKWLDELLKFKEKPIDLEEFPKDDKATGVICGHETQRWITIFTE